MRDALILLFGATGDLATTRLLPALFNLYIQNKLGNTRIIGAALSKTTVQDLLEKVARTMVADPEQLTRFAERMSYVQIDFSDESAIQTLSEHVQHIEERFQLPGNRLIYFSVAPHFFCSLTEKLASHRVIFKASVGQVPWCRVVYEKPFGSDYASAHSMNLCIGNFLDESQIYRVDHYLAKNIVDTIALLRFTNRVFEPLWNKEHLAYVEIVLEESIGMEGRGAFYDTYGALRDVVQNHMLQVLSLIAMEAPVSLTGEFIRDEKARVLKATRVTDVLAGQYAGYHEEAGVAPDSKTETFAMLRLEIDMPRWQGVPFYLKTGKRLEHKQTYVRIQFKPVKCLLKTTCPTAPNRLDIRIKPEPGFGLQLNVKQPGSPETVEPVMMDFCYDCQFGTTSENAYQILIEQILKGESSVSVRFDEIEYAWRIIDAAHNLIGTVHEYEPGSAGPLSAEEFQSR